MNQELVLLWTAAITSIIAAIGMTIAAFRLTSKMTEEKANLKKEMVSSFISILKDPVSREQFQKLFMDQDFMMSVSKVLFKSLSGGIYALFGVNPKDEKAFKGQVIKQVVGKTNWGKVAGLLPDKGWGKKLKEDPSLLPALLEVLQQAMPMIQKSGLVQQPPQQPPQLPGYTL